MLCFTNSEAWNCSEFLLLNYALLLFMPFDSLVILHELNVNESWRERNLLVLRCGRSCCCQSHLTGFKLHKKQIQTALVFAWRHWSWRFVGRRRSWLTTCLHASDDDVTETVRKNFVIMFHLLKWSDRWRRCNVMSHLWRKWWWWWWWFMKTQWEFMETQCGSQAAVERGGSWLRKS